MLIHDLFTTAVLGVSRNRSRALLTMLGIIIGVASVVLMSSVGESMKSVILSQISSLGPKSMVIFPGREEGGASAVATGFDSLTFDDLEELEKLKTIQNLAPVMFVPGTVQYEREEGSPQVFGVTEKFFTNQTITATSGRVIDAQDIEGAKAVAVIAPDVVKKFFGARNPIGERIKIGDQHYTVIGITKALGSQFFQNADNRIYVPFSVARNVTGQKYLNYVTMEATDNFDLAFADVKGLIRQRHDIENPEDDPAEDDFVVHSSAEAAEILGTVSVGLTAFITTIAAISLLVGGIGIMNIMLVSVTERTMEIGLRKALGAQSRDILRQFLIESVLLTLLGGIIGLLFGIGFAYLAAIPAHNMLATYQFAVSVPAIFASLLMAIVTGLVFGISPARRASKLHPIEALRYE